MARRVFSGACSHMLHLRLYPVLLLVQLLVRDQTESQMRDNPLKLPLRTYPACQTSCECRIASRVASC